ncbi:MAG: hypothetical protein JWP20_2127 [Roseomonas sp.]|jgi:hypothetical protein|nr:hypothetical protein [Roseomonas sp.]
MGFSRRLPLGLFRAAAEQHPRMIAALQHLEGLKIPRERALVLLRSLMVHVVEDLGGSYLGEMSRRLERIETIRGRIAGAVEHVVENGVLPPDLDHPRFSALFGELQKEMDALTSVQRHAETLSAEASAQRIVDGAKGPAAPRPGQVAPHPPESLAAAMDAARLQQPAGAAIIDRLLTSPEHGDALGLALAMENQGGRTRRLAELGQAAHLTDAELRELTAAVDAMGLARARMQRVDPAALARRQAAVAGFPKALADRVVGDNTLLGPMAEANRGQVLVYWKRWQAKGGSGSFGEYVRREMISEGRPTVSEWSAAFHLGSEPGSAVIKDAAAFDPQAPGGRRVNPRDPGTDLLLMRNNDDLWYVDDKAHRGGVGRDPVALSGVSAFEGPRFVKNMRDDIRDIEAALRRQREAGQVPDPRLGDTLARLRAAADDLDATMRGWTDKQYLEPQNLRAVRSVLDRHRIRLRVTSELGDVSSMTSRLEGLGIRVIPPIGKGSGM